MASQKRFFHKNILIRVFPEEKIIRLQPTSKVKLQDLDELKDKIETLVRVEASNFERNSEAKIPAIAIQLHQDEVTNIDELLRSIGVSGGQSIETAADIASSVDEEEQQALKASQQGTFQASPGNLQATESFNPAGLLIGLYEGLRYAKYWETLSRGIGMPKEKIAPRDVITGKKNFSRKPKTSERDDILRALDRAADYFEDRIEKKKGEGDAAAFRRQFESAAGSTDASDYSDSIHVKRAKAGFGEEEDQLGNVEPMKVADMFPEFENEESDAEEDSEEDLYQDIEKGRL